MTQEQIENGKRLCCDFMGLKPTPSHGGGWGWSDTPYFSTQNNPDYDVALNDIVKYAKYDSDWNWLMGVVKKISDLAYETEGLFETEEYMMVGLFVMRGNIEGAFPCIVKLLDFYNDNSSK